VNYSLFQDIQGLHGNGVVDAVMEFSAQYLLVAVFAVLGLLLLARPRTDGIRQAVRDALWPGGALVLSYLLGLVAAAVHPEARPFTTHPSGHPLIAHHPGQAFPSDHSTAAFAIALVALVFLARRWGAALLAGAVLIGFSRVYVGVHYPDDILGSVLVSVIGVGSVALLHFRLRTGAQPSVTGAICRVVTSHGARWSSGPLRCGGGPSSCRLVRRYGGVGGRYARVTSCSRGSATRWPGSSQRCRV